MLTFRAQRMEIASTPQRSAEESAQSLLLDYRKKGWDDTKSGSLGLLQMKIRPGWNLLLSA